MIAVDSSVWINHLRDKREAKDLMLDAYLRKGRPVAITDVVYMELLQGVRPGADAASLRLTIDQTRILRLRTLDDFEFAAQLFKQVRASGHTVRKSIGCLIAAVCIREDVPLLHDDIDFDRIADVSDLRVA